MHYMQKEITNDMKDLTTLLTAYDFKAFPQKQTFTVFTPVKLRAMADDMEKAEIKGVNMLFEKDLVRRVSLSVACNDNNRYFLTSEKVEGTKSSKWLPGAKMIMQNVVNKAAAGLGPINS